MVIAALLWRKLDYRFDADHGIWSLHIVLHSDSDRHSA
jgi:hypothetical protein